MRPKLRDDLRILRLNPRQFLLRDPRSGLSFELGPEERFLTAQFDGQTTLDQVRQRFVDRFGRNLTSRYLSEFVEQLRVSGLLVDAPGVPAVAVARPKPAARGVNRLLGALNYFFGWLVHPLCLPLAMVVVLLGLTILYQRFGALQAEIRGIVADHSWAVALAGWLVAVFLLLSLPVALIRGMTIRKFGGWVRSLKPALHRGLVPYWECDPGDSFLTMNERGCWTVLWAGLVARPVVASLAAIAWRMAPVDSVLSHLLVAVIVPGYLSTLLRLNPLVKFDVYAMLLQHFQEPDLYERARAECTAWLTWSRSPEALSPERRSWFRFYGLLIQLFSWLATGLVLGLGAWLVIQQSSGPLALAAVVLVMWWYHEEIGRFLMSYSVLSWLVHGGGKWYIRWPMRLALLALIALCGLLPYRHEVGGEVRLLPLAEFGIRAQTQGEISELNAREGELLESGAVVARLNDREQRAAVEATEAELAEAQARLDLLRAGTREEKVKVAIEQRDLARIRLEYYEGELKRIQELSTTKTVSEAAVENALLDRDSAQKTLAAAEESLRELQNGPRAEEIRVAEAEVKRIDVLLAQRRKELELTAIHLPKGGRLVTSHVDARVGTYVQPGDLIAVVKDASILRAEIAATQQAAVHIRPGQRVNIRLWGTDGELIQTRVKLVAPEAVDEQDVKRQPVRSDREMLAQRTPLDPDQRFVRVYAELDNENQQLLPEMTGYARIVVEKDQLWRALARPVLRFFRVEVWSWLP